MKKLHLIGNIKMNFTKDEANEYLTELKALAEGTDHTVGVAMPSVYLHLASDIIGDSKTLLGAQNVNYNNFGAFTGEINAEMIKDFNVNFALVGHSERRSLFKELDEDVNKKVKELLKHNITPIVCVGETLQEREDNQTEKVLSTQIKKALNEIDLEDAKNIIFAYEPVWAIGTGVSATSSQADEGCLIIKNKVNSLYGSILEPVVLYGGSLNSKNAHELLSCQNINGGLIGGASLKAKTFSDIFNMVI